MVSGAAGCGEAGGPAAVLAGDRGGAFERGRGPGTAVYPKRWDRGGSGRPAACHHHIWRRRRRCLRGGTCRSSNARRSRCCAPRATACGRSLGVSAARHRRSRASCAATRPPAAAAWSTERRQRNGTPSVQRGGRRRRSSRRTMPFAATSRTVSLAGSCILTARFSTAPARCGGSAAMAPGKRAGGRGPGAPSRSRPGLGSTSPRTRRCASAMRPSTSPSTSRVAARCGAS